MSRENLHFDDQSKQVVFFLLMLFYEKERIAHPPEGGGVLPKNWVGVCSPLPKTLTLFMTKICDIPYPIYDLTKNLKLYL